MPHLLLVMLGGAIGSGARFLFGRMTLAWLGPNYPWGTLGVNLIGGFAMGLLVGSLARIGQGGDQLRLILGVGLLGGDYPGAREHHAAILAAWSADA